jgi:O-acetylserine/cysteine efflux transporter
LQGILGLLGSRAQCDAIFISFQSRLKSKFWIISATDWLRVLVPPVFWGLSFVAIKIGLESFTPFTLCALRFFLAGFPLILFFPFPRIPKGRLIAYSFCIGVLQYALMFWAIQLKLPAGLSSVLIQAQVYITIFMAYLFFKEKVTVIQILGFVISAAGLVLIGLDYFQGARPVGFILILLSAFFWSAGNILLKTFKITDFAGFIAWTSFISAIPLLGISFAVDGPASMLRQIGAASFASWLAIAFMAFFATFTAFTLFSKMMLKLPSGKVMPFGTLVPVFGLGSNALFLGERLPAQIFMGAILVIAGLVVAVVLSNLAARRARAVS